MTAVLHPVPENPLLIAEQWFRDACANKKRRNPGAMALATVSSEGRPSVRTVLLKELSDASGYAVFYTHYGSRKANELEQNSRAAAVLYWEEFGRQLRFEGRVLRSPSAESDAYFLTRPWASQLNAWASEQSQAIASHEELLRKARHQAANFGVASDADFSQAEHAKLPRPPNWGGYRLWFEAIELWAEGGGRFHERVRYERKLSAGDENTASFVGGSWSVQILQP